MMLAQILSIGAIAVKNFLLGGNLVSMRWLTQPIKMLEYNAETIFLFKALANERGLPQRNVFDVLPAKENMDITLGALHSESTWFSKVASYSQDISSLCLLSRILEPKLVFEIGTGKGYTTLHFALNTPDDSRIITLDLPRNHAHTPALKTTAMDDLQMGLYKNVADYLFQGQPVAHKITCLHGDSAAFDFTPYRGKVDLFFIDGAHSYEYVRSDTSKALECCHPGSVIAWHDFGRAGLNGVSRWLQEFSQTHKVYVIPGGALAYMVVP